MHSGDKPPETVKLEMYSGRVECLSDKWQRYQDIASVTPVHLKGNIYSLVVTILCRLIWARGIFLDLVRSSELNAVILRNSFNSFIFVKNKAGCM
jgi:hypothetical protein